MKTPFKYIVSIAALTAALTLSARAHFVEDRPIWWIKLYFDQEHHNVNDFEGFAGGNHPYFPHVRIQTVGNVDTGSGFSTIKPLNDESLTKLIFTPDDPNKFGNFSFRGQLEGRWEWNDNPHSPG